MMASQSDPGPRFKSVQVIESSPPPQEESAWSLRGVVRILSGDLLIGASSDQPERDVDVNVTNTRFVPGAGGGNRWQAAAAKAVVTLHPGSGTTSPHAARDIEAGEALRSASRASRNSGLSPVVSPAELARGAGRAKARTGNAAASVTWDGGSQESAERYRPKRHVSGVSTFPSDVENSVPDITDIK